MPALLVPTACTGKDSVAGENASGAVAPPEPVPAKEIICGLNEEASVRLTAPVIMPLMVGENVTARLHFPVGARVPVQVVPDEAMAKSPLAAVE